MRITMTFDKGWSESGLGWWPVTAIEVIAIEVEVLTICRSTPNSRSTQLEVEVLAARQRFQK